MHATASATAAFIRTPPLPLPQSPPNPLVSLSFDPQVINYEGVAPPTLAEVCSAASKAVTFIDLGGHHAFLKTTLFGLTSMLPGRMGRPAS